MSSNVAGHTQSAVGDAGSGDALLRAFAADTRRALEESTALRGQLIAGHIGRQLDLLTSPRYADWFREAGSTRAFDQARVLAAIAGSDVTRPSWDCATTRSHFGSTEERVRSLAHGNHLRYGKAFAAFGLVEDLYMHAEAGRDYTLGELLRRGQDVPGWGEIARDVSDAIVGHDTFNAGFGQHRLKPLLVAIHGGSVDDYRYPTSVSANGFLVQVMDRLDAASAETMVRYVTEGVADRNEPMSTAVKVGVIDNATFLVEALERVRSDARALMDAATFACFETFPGVCDLACKLAAMMDLANLLTLSANPSDKCYHLRLASGSVCLDSLDAVHEHLPAALDWVSQSPITAWPP